MTEGLALLQGFPYFCSMTNDTSAYGYVYKTTNLLTGRFYIGKKAYLHKRTVKLTKKELAARPKGSRKKTKVVHVDSKWQDYYGSSLELKADIIKYGRENFTVEKLRECPNRKSLAYWETYYMFHFDVLGCDTYNGNILGRFYRKDTI